MTNKKNQTSQAQIEQANAVRKIRAFEKAISLFREEMRAREHKRFVDAGGCQACRGRGWVVTWDTMDSMSGCYAEYGACPNEKCTPEIREKTGIDSSSWSKYDRNRGVQRTYPELEVAAMKVLENDLAKARNELDAIVRKWTPAKGKTVKVTACRGGCTAEKGMVGKVFWAQKNNWGILKLGIKVDGEVYWTTQKSVDVIDPVVDNGPEARLEDWYISSETEKAKKLWVSLTNGQSAARWVPNSAIRIADNGNVWFAKWWLDQNTDIVIKEKNF